MSVGGVTGPSRRHVVLFDLDGTLVAGDSFRYFLSRFHRDPRVMLVVAAYGFLRALNLISRARFFRATTRAARGSLLYEGAVVQTVAWCRDHWRDEVIAHARLVGDDREVLRVVISASPHDYVGQLEGLLGGPCFGSRLEEREGRHLFGSHKRDWLVEHLGPETHRYLASYSDSPSDAPVVDLFERRFRVVADGGSITEWPN